VEGRHRTSQEDWKVQLILSRVRVESSPPRMLEDEFRPGAHTPRSSEAHGRGTGWKCNGTGAFLIISRKRRQFRDTATLDGSMGE